MASKIQQLQESPRKKKRLSKDRNDTIKCVYNGEIITCDNKDEFNIYTSIENKQYHIAQNYIKKYILYLKKNKMYSDIHIFIALLAETYYETGKFDIARKHLENLKNLFIEKKKYHLLFNSLIRIFVIIKKEQGVESAYEFLNNDVLPYTKYFRFEKKLDIYEHQLYCLVCLNKNDEAFKLSKKIIDMNKNLVNGKKYASMIYGYIMFYQFYAINRIISNDYSKENLEYAYDLLFKDKISNKSEFIANFIFNILMNTILFAKHYNLSKLKTYSLCLFEVASKCNIEDELKKFLVHLHTLDWFNEFLSEKKNLIEFRHFMSTLKHIT
jgi:hypothetical protein